ncbi:MAG TPA: PIN domain-containing protein [Spirochaetia bacterium]|nr:PIN domain-containing protein [Spirochaetia bacterium]
MRIMIDTNVVISAILKQGSVPDIVLNDVYENHELILCDHIISESYEVTKRRFPGRVDVLDNLFAKLRYELVPAPRTGEILIRDIKDQPILSAAIAYGVDVLIIGDKHFLGLGLETPQIMTPFEYKEQYMILLRKPFRSRGGYPI